MLETDEAPTGVSPRGGGLGTELLGWQGSRPQLPGFGYYCNGPHGTTSTVDTG